MAHQSLYRKYRPSTFDDVVGQQHIERTLRNAVAEGTVAHAYLFTGPRGTGKTTTARLLAKALLCDRGPTAEPDGTCDQCVEVAEGRHPDVFELDAASRTGVDDVRDAIIGRVQYAPTRGRYKVYIIDEVHMLSVQAFNALLKTLEEPPPHVIFIMCTTHPHKVPDTIHSRCQRFDFRRISIEEIADRLRYIAEAEGFRVDRGAFTLMAKHAEGGMRDAITALEQLAAFTGGEITVDDVEGMLGEVDSAQLFEIAALIARRDIVGCFRWVAATVETGTDLAELVSELTGHVRDLYVVAAVGDARGVVDRTADEMALLKAQAMEFNGPDRLARVLDLLGELGSEMRWSSDPRLSLEVALTRLARPQGEMTLEAVAERVEMLERFQTGAPAVESPAPAPQAPSASEETVAEAPVAVADTPVTPSSASVTPADPCLEPPVTPVSAGATLDRGTAKRNWSAVLVEIKKIKASRASTFAQVEVDVDADGKTLVLEFPGDQPFALRLAEQPDTREIVKSALVAVYGFAPPFRCQLGRGAVRPEPTVAPAPEPVRVDVAPDAPDVAEQTPAESSFEQAAGISQPVERHDGGEPVSAVKDLLLNGLGVDIVSEHAAVSEDAEQAETPEDDATETEPLTLANEDGLFTQDPDEKE